MSTSMRRGAMAAVVLTMMLAEGRTRADVVVFFHDVDEPPNTTVTVKGWPMDSTTIRGRRTEEMTVALKNFLFMKAPASGTFNYVLDEPAGEVGSGSKSKVSDIVTFQVFEGSKRVRIHLDSRDGLDPPRKMYGSALEVAPFNTIPVPRGLGATEKRLVVRVASIPEPSSILLAGSGGLILAAAAWRRRRREPGRS